MTHDDPAALIRRLRAEVHRLTEDNEDLRERLAYAELQIQQLRAKVEGRMNQAAAPTT
jgi:predicted  nucleic acid-binding Zn-ribbon protein